MKKPGKPDEAKPKTFVEKLNERLNARQSGWAKLPQPPARQPQVSSPSRTSSIGKGYTVHSVQLPKDLDADQHGVVWTDLTPEMFPTPGAVVGKPIAVDHVALRTALLFADRIDIPDNSAISIPSPAMTELPADITQRSRIIVDGEASSILQQMPFEAFLALERRAPGRWTLARGAQSLGIPPSRLGSKTAFALTIANALPVFERSVPYEDVLEHKAKYYPELIALRSYLKEVVQEACNNGVNSLGDTAAFRRFDEALAAHMKVMGQSNLPKIMTSLKASVSWDLSIPVAVEIGLTQTAMSSGVLSAGALLAFHTARGLKGRSDPNPFEYLTTVSRQLY